MEQSRLTYLFEKHLSGTATPGESEELSLFALKPSATEQIGYQVDENWKQWNTQQSMDGHRASEILKSISDHDHASVERPVHFLKTAWFRYAAAIILLLGAVTAVIVSRINDTQPQNEIAKEQSAGIQPGSNRATLTLSDGSIIVLDSAAIGTLAEQGGTKLVKPDAGSLVYDAGITTTEVVYNTISTPYGGQYQIVLPDGTRVWLNAASSIRFPTTFDKNRTVEITGESYLEVAADKSKPFFVKSGTALVQVLGTSFNINAYTDEEATKATLVEGSIKVSVPEKPAVVLAPGQQVIINNTISIRKNVNTEQVQAWKNGTFDFNNKKLPEAMRMISRWYNVEIVYEKGIPGIEISGEMGRDLSLSQLLEGLADLNVHCRLKGRKLVILP